MQLPPADIRPKLSSRARLQTDKVTGKPVLLYPEGVLMLNLQAMPWYRFAPVKPPLGKLWRIWQRATKFHRRKSHRKSQII